MDIHYFFPRPPKKCSQFLEGTDLSAGLGTLLLIQKHEETLLQKVNVMNLIDRLVCGEKNV